MVKMKCILNSSTRCYLSELNLVLSICGVGSYLALSLTMMDIENLVLIYQDKIDFGNTAR